MQQKKWNMNFINTYFLQIPEQKIIVLVHETCMENI